MTISDKTDIYGGVVLVLARMHNEKMSLQPLFLRANEIAARYRSLNEAKGEQPWNPRDYALGLFGDGGDLAKLVMGAEGLRDFTGGRDALAHELADCLWSVLVLAGLFGIDLEQAFTTTMDQLDTRITNELTALKSDENVDADV
jgi:NTP pyrophosphatase (non-canonical NTP hydrolase)